MKTRSKTTIALGSALAVLLLAGTVAADGGDETPVQLAHMPGSGPGWGMGPGYGMGPGWGMGPGYGMGPGMMHRGFGRGAGAWERLCGPAAALDRELGTDDVRKMMERRLAWRGNDRLKVGKVEEKDDNVIVAEIVTVDDSLVERFEIDRATGRVRRAR